VVVLLQAHKAFDLEAIVAGSKSVFDTRGILSGANVERL
jgi:preprotein translocase subunit SecG